MDGPVVRQWIVVDVEAVGRGRIRTDAPQRQLARVSVGSGKSLLSANL